MGDRIRNCRFLVSLTDTEMDDLMAKVRKTGLTRNTYIRSLIANSQPKELPHPDFYEVLKTLRQISINMNQIAIKANTTGDIAANAYWDNSRRLQQAIGEIKSKYYEK